MRSSLILLLCSLAGVVGGAALIGWAAVGGAVIFDSLAVGVFALLRDDGQALPAAAPGEGGTLHDILEKARDAR